MIAVGLTGVGPSGPPVEASAKTFLLDWEDQDYAQVAALTTGPPHVVAATFRAVYRQLGAQDLDLGLGPVTIHGDRAHAYFYASFDLGRGGLSWSYRGSMNLRRSGSGWLVVWTPSIVAPGLAAGDRLAVLTTSPQRAVLLDQQGKSLIPYSRAYEIGVYPGQVTDPLRTAQRLAKVTGLAQSDAVEMTGQIQAWSPRKFLELVLLTPKTYHRLAPRLAKIPHLHAVPVHRRLFVSSVPVITGQVATETAKTLVEEGEPYRPGTTIGLSGLQQAFQSKLAGKPSTEIVVQNAAGKNVRVLRTWTGAPASNVSTTINASIQQAATSALAGVGLSAAIVAVRAGTGKILATARHTKHKAPTVSPLDGQYQPGQAFTIISAAALLAKKSVTADTKLKCYPQNPVGGEPFTNVPHGPKLGASPTFSQVFAQACSTEFAVLSYDLSAAELTGTAQRFGIGGVPWKLPVPAVTGSMSSPGTNQAELAADMIGSGSVVVSPLDMALVAGAVESGTWQAPQLVTTPVQTPKTVRLSPKVLKQLRNLMWITVHSGAAKAARQSGPALYGQVGSAPLPGHHHLRAIWFVGYRGKVAFTVLVFARSAAFTPAVQIAGRFAAALP